MEARSRMKVTGRSLVTLVEGFDTVSTLYAAAALSQRHFYLCHHVLAAC